MVNVFKSRMLWKLFVCWTWHVRIEQASEWAKRTGSCTKATIFDCEQCFEHFQPIVSALCIILFLALVHSISCCKPFPFHSLAMSAVLFRNRKVRPTPTKFFLFNYPRFGKWKKNYLNEKNSHTKNGTLCSEQQESAVFRSNCAVVPTNGSQLTEKKKRNSLGIGSFLFSFLRCEEEEREKSLNSSINYCQNGKVVLISRVVVTSSSKSGKTALTSKKIVEQNKRTNEFKVESKKKTRDGEKEREKNGDKNTTFTRFFPLWLHST